MLGHVFGLFYVFVFPEDFSTSDPKHVFLTVLLCCCVGQENMGFSSASQLIDDGNLGIGCSPRAANQHSVKNQGWGTLRGPYIYIYIYIYKHVSFAPSSE